ncbi:zinc finger, CCHC-type containing protein [Tanacetum coccineum]|uniref:Zinc finger, CCHC-type containing protein n=1 Tax=Tanacetum coccineum TaxID=301880 RepID=A0ABQ5D211_9ASTR
MRPLASSDICSSTSRMRPSNPTSSSRLTGSGTYHRTLPVHHVTSSLPLTSPSNSQRLNSPSSIQTPPPLPREPRSQSPHASAVRSPSVPQSGGPQDKLNDNVNGLTEDNAACGLNILKTPEFPGEGDAAQPPSASSAHGVIVLGLAHITTKELQREALIVISGPSESRYTSSHTLKLEQLPKHTQSFYTAQSEAPGVFKTLTLYQAVSLSIYTQSTTHLPFFTYLERWGDGTVLARLFDQMTSVDFARMARKASLLLPGEKLYMNQPQGFIMPDNENKLDLTKEFLSSRFSMKDIGETDVILGIRIKHESNGIAIYQSYYTKKVLKKFNYFDYTRVSTPMDTSEKLMPNNGQAVSQLMYYMLIDSLMYAMTCTRPGIAFAIGKLSRQFHLLGLGYFCLVGGANFLGRSEATLHHQSIMELWEFGLLAAADKEAEWLRNMILEIPLWSKHIAPICILCDSAATLAKAYSQMYNGKSRHLGVRHSKIHELIMNGVVSIEFVRYSNGLKVIMEYLVKISKKARILELK